MARFSIILPVRNGANHVRQCVDSILRQSCNDLELLVLENASTDNTIEIIKSFNDHRIKIFPAPEPLSMADNWKRAVAVDKSEFMTLIGHDDVLDADYLKGMNELIAAHPTASLFQAHFRYIDGGGRETGRCQP